MMSKIELAEIPARNQERPNEDVTALLAENHELKAARAPQSAGSSMALSSLTEDLKGIEERNEKRKELKRSASPGPWEYDSFGFIHQAESVKPAKRIGILLRPITWFRKLQDKYGSNFLDTGFSQPDFIQAYYDAEYIIEERNTSVEEDIEALLAEVRRLQRKGQ